MTLALLDLVFPPRCVHCHSYLKRGSALCGTCRRRVVLHRAFFCGKCRGRRYSEQGRCHRKFPYALAVAGEYEDPVLQELIRALKFHFIRDSAEALGSLLANYVARLKIGPRPILPVPLSRRRQRERGYNQSELIARALARRTGAPVETSALQRIRNTRPQSGLRGDAARRANISGCFRVIEPQKITGRNIILLDDVVTTGATLLEATLALKAAGAKNILALAAAKA